MYLYIILVYYIRILRYWYTTRRYTAAVSSAAHAASALSDTAAAGAAGHTATGRALLAPY